ncbi:cytochrome c biogenesis protein CcdA [Aureimonas fodinaquatilis]|uniref:Cytochrome c biogenesis protein CcdA n=1 Tax=Aureimonas fodinaquatilis TaxID=2565783 RepID=A0A5B0DVS1_9HYPH|nr:cytochrome c biogenesis protein CcdA [Aureimonas fodinaquatilis]KAA0970448.1 cytochrome c biogenesis protein CcdA [Aureimonas fodinaquatilis]
MLSELSYPTAILAGSLSFLSPCVLPLVPPYLCYMAGVSVDDLRDGTAESTKLQGRVVLSAVIFVLGFTTVFVLLGAGASSVGQLLRRNMDWLAIVAGVGIIIMGLNYLGVLRLSFLSREMRVAAPDKPRNFFGAYLMGLAFAFGWTPCIGPVLGAILGVAGTQQTVGQGAVLLAFYSAGLGIPFILAAVFSGFFLKALASLRNYYGVVQKVMGGLLVATGVLFITGGMQAMSFWLLETFPSLQFIG